MPRDGSHDYIGQTALCGLQAMQDTVAKIERQVLHITI